MSKDHRRFVSIFFLFLTPLLLGAAIINYAVDPFAIHQSPIVSKCNEVKVCLESHDRLHKAIEIGRKKPKALFLGSSRVLALQSDDFNQTNGLDFYNAGLRGANFEEIYHYFEHALYHQPDLKLVVIGLDFCAFNQALRPTADFSLERLKGKVVTWRDFNASLFSWDALKSSFITLKSNYYHNPSQVAQNEIVAKGDVAYLKMTLANDYKSYKTDPKKIQMFKQLVETCKKHSIELKAFFCPMQAIYWEAIYRHNLWPQFEDLKRQLCAIHPIWDFSGFNCVTMRTLEETVGESFYYECSHFRPIVGKLMAEKMFDSIQSPKDFGFLLTPSTIEWALEQVRQEAKNWLESHDDITKQIQQARNW